MITRPLMRYHGGKFRLWPWLAGLFPDHRVYCEPFGGGASVLLRKSRSPVEVYNDLDGEIVNLFRVVRDRGDELRRAVALSPFARTEFELSYEVAADPLEQARRTMLRSWLGYGSTNLRTRVDGRTLMRSGFAGCRRYRKNEARCFADLPDAIEPIIARLQGVCIEHDDASAVMCRYDSPDTLHYVDPPYVATTRADRRNNRRGYRHEMSDDDHRQLAVTLGRLRGGIIVSGYPCDLYDRELYAGWRRLERPHVALNARATTEVVWMRNVRSPATKGVAA